MRGGVWALAAGLWAWGCNQSPVSPVEPAVGSETHWLAPCPADGCPDGGACVCGVCTVACDAEPACDGVGGVCWSGPELPAACEPAAAGGVCLAECTVDADCPGAGRCDGGACVGTLTISRQAPARPKLDFLFVVDSSGSMCGAQSALAAELAAALPALGELDWRLAVTSTDFADPAARGRFLAAPASLDVLHNCPEAVELPVGGCQALLAEGGLPSVLSSDQGYSDAELSQRLACLVSLGTQGDGFEAGLEATRQATACVGPNAGWFAPCCTYGEFDPACDAPLDFLRPDASLVVVVLSDEDDCSVDAQAGLLADRAVCALGRTDRDGDGLPDGLEQAPQCAGASPGECFARECGDLALADCYAERCTVPRTHGSACVHTPTGLVAPDRYASHLQGLKLDPGAVAVWPLTGPDATTADGTSIRFVPGEPPAGCDGELLDVDACCDAGGRCLGPVRAVCDGGDLGPRHPAPRYAAVSRALGSACVGAECAQCVDSDALNLVGWLAERLPRPISGVCLGDLPADAALQVTVEGEPVGPAGWTLVPDRPGTCGAAVILDRALAPGETLTVDARLPADAPVVFQ